MSSLRLKLRLKQRKFSDTSGTRPRKKGGAVVARAVSELVQLSGRFPVMVFPGGVQKFYAQDCASFVFSENMIDSTSGVTMGH